MNFNGKKGFLKGYFRRKKVLNLKKKVFSPINIRDGSVVPVSRYREHFTEIP